MNKNEKKLKIVKERKGYGKRKCKVVFVEFYDLNKLFFVLEKNA